MEHWGLTSLTTGYQNLQVFSVKAPQVAQNEREDFLSLPSTTSVSIETRIGGLTSLGVSTMTIIRISGARVLFVPPTSCLHLHLGPTIA